MRNLASVAAASLLLASARAMPNLVIQPRATDAVTDATTDAALEPWVTVNEDGKPSTVTPVLTTISGTPTVVSAAPHDVTATVFTYTSYGKIVTSTGTEPPAPTATGSESAGSFALCNNLDGDLAPWCRPDGETPLYVGTTYYFTWDPKYFKSRNSTVQIIGNHINKTTGEVRTESPAFTSNYTPAGYGYVSIAITDQPLLYQGSQNISCVLFALDGGQRVERPGPMITIMKRPGPSPDSKGKLPQGAALYIALPTVLGLLAVCGVGTCLWNRHHRRILLPNVMGRNYDVSKTGRSRLGLKKKGGKAAVANERIQLMERELQAEGGEVYHDLPDPADRPRRDSDALGSLVGTPTEERRMEFGRPGAGDGAGRTPATGNAFRDELRRQEDARS